MTWICGIGVFVRLACSVKGDIMDLATPRLATSYKLAITARMERIYECLVPLPKYKWGRFLNPVAKYSPGVVMTLWTSVFVTSGGGRVGKLLLLCSFGLIPNRTEERPDWRVNFVKHRGLNKRRLKSSQGTNRPEEQILQVSDMIVMWEIGFMIGLRDIFITAAHRQI